jgi:hypothetical protein
VTNKTLDNTSLTILDTNKYVTSDLSLTIDDHCIGNETKIIPILKIGTDSVTLKHTTGVYTTSTINVLVSGSNSTLASVDSKFVTEGDILLETELSDGVLVYNISSNSPQDPPTVSEAGKFIANASFYEANILSKIVSLDLEYGGYGYVLDTGSNTLENQYFSQDDSPNSAEINCSLAANSATLELSGGVNYLDNDTFTLTDGAVTATYSVTVDDQFGSISAITLESSDAGFTSTPTVTYNGSTGSGVTINVVDNYAIGSVTLIGGGGAAYINDSVLQIIPFDSSDNAYDPDRFATVRLTTECGEDSVDITKFLLDSFEVRQTGNNLRDDSNVILKDTSVVLENVVGINSLVDSPVDNIINRQTFSSGKKL